MTLTTELYFALYKKRVATKLHNFPLARVTDEDSAKKKCCFFNTTNQ